jgi:hypothetical protein
VAFAGRGKRLSPGLLLDRRAAVARDSAAHGRAAGEAAIPWAAAQHVDHDADLFLSIAEIAGVFVGFGALISFSRDRTMEARALRMVVTIGLVVLVAALLPVWLARYALTERALWAWSSGAFLLIIWVAILGPLLDPSQRAWMKAESRAHPVFMTLFLVALEIPIQVPLVLVILGVAPTLSPAFYVTALVLNLIEAAVLLARIAFTRVSQPGP